MYTYLNTSKNTHIDMFFMDISSVAFNLKNISTKVIDIKDFNKSFSDGCENYIKDGNKNIQWVMYEYDKREPLNNNAQVTLINFN